MACSVPVQREPDEFEPGAERHGWQHEASSRVEREHRERRILPRLADNEKAMLRSQSGPGAGLALSATPSSPSSRIEPHLFRVLLLRRLRLPLPPVSRTCRCGRPTDVLGHHRAACARAGVLGRRGFALESAAARVSRRRRQSILQRHGERSGLEGARRARRSSPRSHHRTTSAIWRGTTGPRHHLGFRFAL